MCKILTTTGQATKLRGTGNDVKIYIDWKDGNVYAAERSRHSELPGGYVSSPKFVNSIKDFEVYPMFMDYLLQTNCLLAWKKAGGKFCNLRSWTYEISKEELEAKLNGENNWALESKENFNYKTIQD